MGVSGQAETWAGGRLKQLLGAEVNPEAQHVLATPHYFPINDSSSSLH